MTVSVVIPCYNAERFVRAAIESALQQTYPAIEIVVVDDGSIDGSRTEIESFRDHVTAVFGPNLGASAARNRGTELATGAFVQYLDADDLLLPDAVERRVESLEDTGADVAYSDWQRLVETSEGEFLSTEAVIRTVESAHPTLEIALFTDFWCPPAALLYRRAIVEKIGGWNQTLPVIQDARFLLDAALMGGRFVHVSGVGALYRVHRGASLSRGSRNAFVRDCVENARQVRAWWERNGGITPERHEALLQVFGHCARTSLELDRALFMDVYCDLRRLESHYAPRRPLSLNVLSRVLGYPRAEAVALTYRRAKRWVGCRVDEAL